MKFAQIKPPAKTINTTAIIVASTPLLHSFQFFLYFKVQYIALSMELFTKTYPPKLEGSFIIKRVNVFVSFVTKVPYLIDDSLVKVSIHCLTLSVTVPVVYVVVAPKFVRQAACKVEHETASKAVG